MVRQESSSARKLISAMFIAVLMSAGATLGAAQTETLIHNFLGSRRADGAEPLGGLLADKNGALYGSAAIGGQYGYGSVYKMLPPTTSGGAWQYRILYSFTGGADGGRPSGALIFNITGSKIYGTTQAGGSSGYGVVYELVPPKSVGPWTEVVLYGFTGGLDGAYPQAGVISDGKGALYGTAPNLGGHDSGVVFRLSPPAKSGGKWTRSILHAFSGDADGAYPEAGLLLDSAGVLYGTTYGGDLNDGGTVFQLAPPATKGGLWTESVLYAFTGGSDGVNPQSTLIFDTVGGLYGTTSYGGQYGAGTVFQLAPPSGLVASWTKTILYSFTGGGDGYRPSGVVLDSTGALYGTTLSAGDGCCGTVFKINPPSTQGGTWTEQVLHSFNAGTDGANPAPGASLLPLGSSFYGATYEGGAGNCKANGLTGCGTIFEITP